MDKRSWPWRKKSSEKILAPTESTESSPAHSSRHLDDQDVSRILADHVKYPDETMAQWQHAGEKLKHLNERLSVALMDISAKDDMVKQHTKVAEEAVSGWEKAEAEALALKQQLDATLQQKLAAEDRVSHLDGALKECVRQLRLIREEQEQKIHEATVKKSRDWENLRCELEEKLEDVGRQLLEAEAEKNVISKSLQERAQTISEISAAQFRAEAELQVLQVQLDSAEKENSVFKYELHVLNKELEIRNEEREISKKGADAASKQHLEDVKKIAKLETECQRLRVLVRKKLPGPAALAQMKLEVETLVKEKGESNNWKRSGGKGVGSPRAMHTESTQDSFGAKETEAMLKRMLAMEEEARRLKETLSERNNELQAARLMCARTASKLSSVEEQLDALSNCQGQPKNAGMTGFDMHIEASRSFSVSKEPSMASASDGNDGEPSCAESWASALIAELAHFKKGKVTNDPDKPLVATNLDLMDDFIEMEQLASMSPSKIGSVIYELNKPKEPIDGFAGNDEETERCNFGERHKASLEQILAEREAELQVAHQLCKEVSRKLATTEEQLNSLQSQNATNQSTSLSLQEKLDLIFEAQQEGSNLEKVVKEVKSSLGVSHCSVVRLQAHIRRLSKSSYPGDICSLGSPEGSEFANPHVSASVDSSSEEETSSSISDVESKTCTGRPDLTSAICKVVRVVEELAVATCAHQTTVHVQRPFVSPDDFSDSNIIMPGLHCSNLELDNSIQKFIAVSNRFVQGKLDTLWFMAELSSIMGQLTRRFFLSADGSARKPTDWERSLHEHEELSGVNSPISVTSKSDGSENGALKIVPADEHSAACSREISVSVSMMEEELQKAQAEKAALESHMRSEFSRLVGIGEELTRLKREKLELETNLEEEKERLKHIKSQLHEAEQLVANLRVQLSSVEEAKKKVDDQLLNVVASNMKIESQLKATEAELSALHDKVELLEKEIQDEHQQNEDLEVKCQGLEQQLQQTGLSCSRCTATDEEARLSKELELTSAAEKLADCQRTILVLGKQLKVLASPRESMDLSYDSTADSALSVGRSSSGRDMSRREASEASSSGPVFDSDQNSSVGWTRSDRRVKQYQGWNCRDSSVSDVLDAELAKLPPKRRHGSGRATTIELFGDETLPHTDYIGAVAQTPSSPDAETVSPPRSSTKPAARRKRSPQSLGGIDFSKSMSEAVSPAASSEKHGSSFSRFFSRTRSSH